MNAWSVYLLKCADNSLYCGVTTDIEARLFRHNQRTASKHTRTRLPVELAIVKKNIIKSEAFKLEYQIKQMPTDKKIAALKDLES